MKRFKLLGYKDEKHIELGSIDAHDLHEVKFFLAVNFPDYYYGAGISQVDGGDYPDFMCIPVKDWFKKEDGTYILPLEDAVKSLDMAIKMRNGLCDEWEEYNGDICRKAWEKLEVPF